MYQAKVKFLVTGRVMSQDWHTQELAIGSLVGLLRVSGYDRTAEEIREELLAGTVHFGTRDYWVEVAA